MPMVYMPNAGDIVTFNKKRGVLVRSMSFDCLSFMAIDGNGHVTAEKFSQNKSRDYFNTAIPITSDEDLPKNFVIAVNAIKAIPAAVTPLL